MISAVVSIVFQIMLLVMLEVKVTEFPTQNVVAPLAVITGAIGFGSTIISIGSETAEQPAPLDTVTVYKPALVTVIEFEV